MRQIILLVAMSAAALGQSASAPDPQAAPAKPATETSGEPAAQMLLDLNQMDGLLNNMATEVSFIQNTNMQILLNTNVRLWSMLLRDLRRQAEAQERQHAARAPAAPKPETKQPH